MGCIALVQCVLVLCCGLAGVVWYLDAGFTVLRCMVSMQASACIDTTPPQPNHNITPTHIIPEQYNPWNNSTNKSQAPEDGCINIRNMLSSKYWNNKASDIKLVSLYLTIKQCICERGDKHLRSIFLWYNSLMGEWLDYMFIKYWIM